MGQFPQQPLNYMGPAPAAPAGRPRLGRSVFGWVVFIALAVTVFMLLSKQKSGDGDRIPLSELMDRLAAGDVVGLTISGDEIKGEFASPQTTPSARTVINFRTQLPEPANWQCVSWILENRHGATVDVRSTDNVLINILLPLIPWILIFGFIWFFTFRVLRRSGQTRQQWVVTGPGRWVPDEPGKAGQP